MATSRTATATWNGSLMEGSGTIHEVGSGAFGPLAVSWDGRDATGRELAAGMYFARARIGRGGEAHAPFVRIR